MARPRRPRRAAAPAGRRLGEPTAIAVRAHAEPDGWAARASSEGRVPPRVALVLLTVAKPVEGEPLRFGVWELLHLGGPWLGAGRGVFYADDLDPSGIAELVALCEAHGWPAPVPRKEFVDTVLWRSAFKQELPLVGWSLPVDLGRLAVSWSRARGADADAVSLTVWTQAKLPRREPGTARRRPVLANGEVENQFRPRIEVRVLDGGRAFISFTRTFNPDRIDLIAEGSNGVVDPAYRKQGRFISGQTLASSLNDEPLHTLAEACDSFAVAPPDESAAGSHRFLQALAEHAALVRLYRQLIEVEHERVGAGRLSPEKVFSQAAYGRAVLDAAGIEPPLARNPDFDRQLLAEAMGATFGGECTVTFRLPPEPLPCLFYDYSSLYAVVASLQQADRLLKADRLVVVEEDPAAVLAELRAILLEDLLDPAGHARLAFRFVELLPDGGWLPHRVPAAKHWKSQVSELGCDQPLIYAAQDVVRAIQETGVVPRLVRAWRIEPVGRQESLRPVQLPSGRTVQPGEDLLLALAEERYELPGGSWKGAKPCASICCSGLFMQLNDSERTAKTLQHVHLWDGTSYHESGTDIEEPDCWYLPPLAASIYAGARLMLHLARQLISQAGGFVAYVDTDSLAILANREGALIRCPGGRERDENGHACLRALSFDQVADTLEPIEQLNPFRSRYGDRGPRLLKLEADNLEDGEQVEAYLHARSTKNYDRYRLSPDRAHVKITKASEHGLGHLAPHWQTDGHDQPQAWVREGRDVLLRRDLQLPAAEPGFFDELAISVVRLNRWSDLKRVLPSGGLRRRGNGPRPFSRLAVAHPHPLHAVDLDGKRVQPVALWHDNLTPAKARWRNHKDGRPLKIRPLGRSIREADITPGSRAPAKTMRDVFAQRGNRHDHGLDHNGDPTSSHTAGLVLPTPTQAMFVVAIGRETTNQDRVGITSDPAYRSYINIDKHTWQLARDTLRILAPGRLPPGRPREADKPDLIRQAGELARRELARLGRHELPTDPAVACHLYLKLRGRLRIVCAHCGHRLGKRERRWCPTCRPNRKRLARNS
jgi:hypothetical protein